MVDGVGDALPASMYFQLRKTLLINAAQEVDPGNTDTFWKVVHGLDYVRKR